MLGAEQKGQHWVGMGTSDPENVLTWLEHSSHSKGTLFIYSYYQ